MLSASTLEQVVKDMKASEAKKPISFIFDQDMEQSTKEELEYRLSFVNKKRSRLIDELKEECLFAQELEKRICIKSDPTKRIQLRSTKESVEQQLKETSWNCIVVQYQGGPLRTLSRVVYDFLFDGYDEEDKKHIGVFYHPFSQRFAKARPETEHYDQMKSASDWVCLLHGIPEVDEKSSCWMCEKAGANDTAKFSGVVRKVHKECCDK